MRVAVVEEWPEWPAHAQAAAELKRALAVSEECKGPMRDRFKAILLPSGQLDDQARIDFAVKGDKVVIKEVPKAKSKRTPDLATIVKRFSKPRRPADIKEGDWMKMSLRKQRSEIKKRNNKKARPE
jgi:hypothetical protein